MTRIGFFILTTLAILSCSQANKEKKININTSNHENCLIQADIQNKLDFEVAELKFKVSTYINEQLSDELSTIFKLEFKDKELNKIQLNNDSSNVILEIHSDLKSFLIQCYKTENTERKQSLTLSCGSGCAQVYERIVDK